MEPVKMEVEDGQKVRVNCSAKSRPPAVFTIGNETWPASETNSVLTEVSIPPGQNFTIVHCQASTRDPHHTLNGYALIVRKGTYQIVPKPQLMPKPKEDHPVRHRSFALVCHVSNPPYKGVGVNLTYTLYHKGDLKSTQSSNTFLFPRVSSKDEGPYTCTARNGAAVTTSVSSNVYYLSAPEEELVETATIPPYSTKKEEEVAVTAPSPPSSGDKGGPAAAADSSASVGWGVLIIVIIIAAFVGLAYWHSRDKNKESPEPSVDGMELLNMYRIDPIAL